jgi:hypothetical protein
LHALLHPEAAAASWKLLAVSARATAKKQASAITEALERARDVADQARRAAVTLEDIEKAIRFDFQPVETQATQASYADRQESLFGGQSIWRSRNPSSLLFRRVRLAISTRGNRTHFSKNARINAYTTLEGTPERIGTFESNGDRHILYAIVGQEQTPPGLTDPERFNKIYRRTFE